jgi:glucosamine-6-phosphate deaminase
VRILTLQSEREVARAAARMIAAAAAANPELVLGLPTGRTVLPLYDALADLHRARELDLSAARSFNLDELLLPPGHPESYRAYMEAHAWSRVGLDPARCSIPDPTADPTAECARYEAELAAAGGLDVAVLGVGADGHIAYNLPGTPQAEAHVVELPDAAAESLGIDPAERPLRALTLGLAALVSARRVLLLATTAEKARAVRALVEGPEDPRWPCTALRDHPQLDVVLTPEAAGKQG